MYDLSLVMASIRPERLVKIYESVLESFHGTWELVIVSPYDLPEGLKDKPNVQYFKDFSTPVRCWQIGLLNAKGTWTQYPTDDAIYYPDSLDKSFELIKQEGNDNVVIAGKYLEGTLHPGLMLADQYYHLNFHKFLQPVMQKIGRDYFLLNAWVISKRLMLELGGFDCGFEACAMACCDLSIRVQNYGVKVILQKEPMFHCTFFQGHSGDHAPVHNAQIQRDQPLFNSIYMGEGTFRTKIPLDNWKDAPEWWSRRFGTKK